MSRFYSIVVVFELAHQSLAGDRARVDLFEHVPRFDLAQRAYHFWRTRTPTVLIFFCRILSMVGFLTLKTKARPVNHAVELGLLFDVDDLRLREQHADRPGRNGHREKPGLVREAPRALHAAADGVYPLRFSGRLRPMERHVHHLDDTGEG